jgi:hypothetical protein
VRSELTDTDPGHIQGAVETHEYPRSQLTDRTRVNVSARRPPVSNILAVVLLCGLAILGIGIRPMAIAGRGKR